MVDLEDRVLGCLYGVALGDALGTPFEFRRTTPKPTYTGLLLEEPTYVQFQYSKMELPPGCISDDTEMTLALLNSILNKENYNEDDAIKYYLDWANLKGTPLGKNTRALMKNITTVKGFRNRQKNILDEKSQSNGSLMRATPLALLDNWEESFKIDTNLTNPTKINQDCSKIYLGILRAIYKNESYELDFNDYDEPLRKYLRAGSLGEILPIDKDRGWVVFGIYVTLYALQKGLSFQDTMDTIYRDFPGSDTDTVMAISGGIIGASLGYQTLLKESKTSINLSRLTKYFENTNRPKIDQTLLDKLSEYVKNIKL